MTNARALLVSVAATLAAAGVVAPQSKLNPEWLALDLAGVPRVDQLVPFARQTLASVEAALGTGPQRDDDLGLGGRRFYFRRGLGSVDISFDGLTFRGRLVRGRIEVDGSGEGWPSVQERLGKPARASDLSGLECDSNGCVVEWVDQRLMAAYQDAVNAALGTPSLASAVPDALRSHYEFLISPWEVIYVGPAGCGLGGGVLEGREAIAALTTANRIDLIVNVLRGPNPGGV